MDHGGSFIRRTLIMNLPRIIIEYPKRARSLASTGEDVKTKSSSCVIESPKALVEKYLRSTWLRSLTPELDTVPMIETSNRNIIVQRGTA